MSRTNPTFRPGDIITAVKNRPANAIADSEIEWDDAFNSGSLVRFVCPVNEGHGLMMRLVEVLQFISASVAKKAETRRQISLILLRPS